MAVLVHHGDMHSGHFVTYRRSPCSPRSSSPFSSQWLWVSDDSVRKASLHEVLSSNAYMLFYERVRRQNPALCSEEWAKALSHLYVPVTTLLPTGGLWLFDNETREESHPTVTLEVVLHHRLQLQVKPCVDTFLSALIQSRRLLIPKIRDQDF